MNEWTPFHSQKKWDLAKWLIKNVGQKSIDEFLQLPIVSMCMHVLSRMTNLFLRFKSMVVYLFIIPICS